MSEYAFPFHGDVPEDWTDHGLEHAYEVRFVAEPGADALRAIAVYLDGTFRDESLASSARAWEWAGPVVRLWLAPVGADLGGGDSALMFLAAGAFFRGLHDVSPVRQVILLGARGAGTSTWGRWSARQPMVPGPFSSTLRPATADDQHPVANPSFEAARADARAASVAPARGISAQPSDRTIAALVGLAFPDGAEAIFHLAGQQPPRIPRDGDVLRAVVPRMVAVVTEKDRAVAIAYAADGARRTVDGVPAGFAWPVVHDDGERGYFRVGNHIHVIDFTTGQATPLFEASEQLERLVMLGEYLIATTPGGLAVYRVGDEPGLESRIEAPPNVGLAATSPDVLWLQVRGITVLYRLRESMLTKIGTINAELRPCPIRIEGELLAHDPVRGTIRIIGAELA